MRATGGDDTPEWLRIVREWPIPSYLSYLSFPSSPVADGENDILSFLSFLPTKKHTGEGVDEAITGAHDTRARGAEHRTETTETTDRTQTKETTDTTETTEERGEREREEREERGSTYLGSRTETTELRPGGDLALPPDRRPAPPRPGVPVIRPEDLDLPIDWEFAQ
jgi:hypothetical protein